MSVLYNRICQLCEIRGDNIYKYERLAGLTKGSVRKWDESIPSGDKIMRLANAFDVSVDYLLGNCDNSQSHKTENAEIPFASELSNVVANLETSAEQTEAQLHRIKSILQVNGIELPDCMCNDSE